VFDSFRDVFLLGRAPTPMHLLYPLAVGFVLLGIGLLVYRWREADFAKEV
jgi:ABC-type polysaccharide/polyol phosphate export permease